MDSDAIESTTKLHTKKDLPGLLNTDPNKLTCPKSPPAAPLPGPSITDDDPTKRWVDFTRMKFCANDCSTLKHVLSKAAESGDLQACITIINQNSSAKNVNDPYGRTALHCAAARGHSHIVKQLIASGLDPSVTDAAGKTARDMASAAMQKYQDSIQMLSAPPTSIWGTSLPKPQPQPLQMPKCITPSVSRDHLTCPKGHTLFKGIRQNQFNCDGCGADSTPNEASFKCSACDYDLCVGCASQKAGIRCPQQSEHTLRRFVTPQPGYGCDVCQRKLGLAAVTAGCRLCDYDVCVDCVSNKATVQVIYPNAYAGDVTHPVPR